MLLGFSSLSEFPFSDFESVSSVDLADIIAQLNVQMHPLYNFKTKTIYQYKQVKIITPIATSVFKINTIIETRISNSNLIETTHKIKIKAIYINND